MRRSAPGYGQQQSRNMLRSSSQFSRRRRSGGSGVRSRSPGFPYRGTQSQNFRRSSQMGSLPYGRSGLESMQRRPRMSTQGPGPGFQQMRNRRPNSGMLGQGGGYGQGMSQMSAQGGGYGSGFSSMPAQGRRPGPQQMSNRRMSQRTGGAPNINFGPRKGPWRDWRPPIDSDPYAGMAPHIAAEQKQKAREMRELLVRKYG